MAWGDDGMGYEGHEAKDVFYADFHAEQKPKTTRWNFCNFFLLLFDALSLFQIVFFFLLFSLYSLFFIAFGRVEAQELHEARG